MKTELVLLRLKDVRLDGDTQSRDQLSPETAREYAEELKAGHAFPAPVVYHDGSNYWMASGFHRWHGHHIAERSHIECEVRRGTVEEAKLFAASCNAAHGLKRNHADKRRAVWMCLKSELAKGWTIEKVAGHCKVSTGLVRAIKESTPWSPPAGLFGEDDLAKPPAPDHAGATGGTVRPEDAAGMSDGDREKVTEGARRAYRKLKKKTDLLGEDVVEFVRRERDAELDGNEENGKT